MRKKRDWIADRIGQLEAAAHKQAAQPGSDADAQTLDSLRAINSVYLEHQNQLEQRSRLEEQLKEADSELAALDQFAPDEPKPYSFLLLENLHDQLAAEKDRQSAIESDTKSSKLLLKTAHEELDAIPSSGGDSPKSGTSPTAVEPATDELAPQRLALVLGRARVALRQTEIEVLALRLKLCENKQKQLAKKIKVVEADVKFTAQDRDQALGRLAETESQLESQREKAAAALRKVDAEKQADLKKITADDPAGRLRDAITEGWRAAAEACQSEMVVLDARIDQLRQMRGQWKRRYTIATESVEPKKMAGWLEELDELLDQFKETANSLQHRLDTARDDQAAIGHDDQGPASELVSRWKKTKVARLGELRDLCVASLDELEAKERTLQRFRQELKAKLAAAPTDWVTSLGESAKSLVGYRVSEGDDASVSVGQLLLLVLLILAGILLAWLASRLARRYMLRFFGLHPGTAAALKSMVFYCLCLIFGVVSFRLLHVPMTAFAFMGGAAAIAIGFGGQDIMNNFMSGIILLVEQPIRVGDVVELEGTRGVVLHIGLRSTRLQTQANYELIVPNHSLLDSSVTNLTLSDNFVQTFVTISVERDVDVQKSKWRMLEIAFSHPLVMKSPRPAALMTEVDTYWITFEIHFWVEYSNYMQIALVQSQILEQISDLFKPPPAASAESTSDPASAEPADGPIEADSANLPDAQAVPGQGIALVARQMKRLGGSKSLKAR